MVTWTREAAVKVVSRSDAGSILKAQLSDSAD